MPPFLPLFPDFLSNELNIVSGLLIGIAFGYVLEQAGFSSSRRLAGLFYGYDFTVLRVFFTAALTAMVGVLLLGRAGWLDLDAIYVNPLFVGPAIAGGAIMGVGFILGGYCPGTSVCAAAIGKKDAIVFVLGGFLGVWAYGEAYPLYAGFVDGGGLGPVKVYDSLGLTRGAFALLLVLAALAAFAATSWIEKRVSAGAPSRAFPVRLHRAAAAAAVAMALLILLLPDRRTRLIAMTRDPAYRSAHAARVMTVDEFVFRLLDDDTRLLAVDLRDEAARKVIAVPGAVNLPLESFFTKEALPLLGRRRTTHLLIDDDGTRSAQAAVLATALGYEDVRVLQGGVRELQRSILDFAPVRPAATAAEADAFRFRAEARQALAARIAAASSAVARPKAPPKKIQGGC